MIFTSGSTSEPKAVVHTHGAVFRKTSVPNPGVAPPGGCVFLGQPFFWVGGLQNLGTALQNGAALVCQPKPEPAAALVAHRAHRRHHGDRVAEHDAATPGRPVVREPRSPRRPAADDAVRRSRAAPRLAGHDRDHRTAHRLRAPGAPKEELATPIPESLARVLRCAAAVHRAQDRRSRFGCRPRRRRRGRDLRPRVLP